MTNTRTKQILSDFRKGMAIGFVLLGRMSVLVTSLYFIAFYEPPILRYVATTIPEPFGTIPSVFIVFGSIFIFFILLCADFWRQLQAVITFEEVEP